uniref:uncharacterized protein LOC122588930 n=1 Tax=Erigeron canadensis TaxID=72917 RepID=UPI001CB99325
DQEEEEKDSENQLRRGEEGVKDDLSEFTESLARQIWGVASFLAPPPPPPPPLLSDHHDGLNCESLINEGEIERVSNSETFDCDDDDEKLENNVVGVTEEVLQFAMNIAHHPETWLDFPLSEDEDDNDDFEMSDTQWDHATLVEHLVPRLAALRIEFCPIHMSESYFWKVYFVLLHPRLNKHDADLLSTPQIVAARTMWMKELQMHAKPELESLERNASHTFDSHEDYNTTSSDSPSAKLSEKETHAFEPTTCQTDEDKHPVLTQEYGSTKGISDQRTVMSFTVPIEDFDEDEDNWIHENSELDGYDGPDVLIGDDEDISFSDLEDDDCTMPTRSKIV